MKFPSITVFTHSPPEVRTLNLNLNILGRQSRRAEGAPQSEPPHFRSLHSTSQHHPFSIAQTLSNPVLLWAVSQVLVLQLFSSLSPSSSSITLNRLSSHLSLSSPVPRRSFRRPLRPSIRYIASSLILLLNLQEPPSPLLPFFISLQAFGSFNNYFNFGRHS